MRARLYLAVLLALVGVGGARAETRTYPAQSFNLTPSGQLSLQLTLDTGTFAVQNRVFVYKYCYTVRNATSRGYTLTGLNPVCDEPFAAEQPQIPPGSPHAGWQEATLPLATPVDPVWFATSTASGLAPGQSGKFVLYSNTLPGKADLLLSGVANGGPGTRRDTVLYWHPDCHAATCPPEDGVQVICRGPFDLAQAYPARPSGYVGSTPPIADNRCFAGSQAKGAANATAVSGVFCLDSVLDEKTGVPALNVNAFVTCPSDRTEPYVQSFRLIKEEPASQKCPMTYRHRIWAQHGDEVRTWWALRYTPPGTTFTLELMVRCKDLRRPGAFAFHINRWIWRVTATLDSLPLVVQVLHTSALGRLDIPCIPGEDTYLALQKGITALKMARTRKARQDALNSLEALITLNGVFAEVVTPDLWRPDCVPENAAQATTKGTLGILESLENPCVCKLIADLEYIGKQLGVS